MLLNLVLWPIALALLALSITSGIWYKLWFFEIIGSTYLWLAMVTLLLWLGLLLVRRLRSSRRTLIVVLAIALGFYASSLLTWYVPRLRDAKTGGIPLTVMTYNVNYRLWQTQPVTALVRSHPVDVFGLIEPSKEQAAELRDAVADLYPYYYRATGGGLSLYSRYPITEATTEDLGTPHHSLFAPLDVKGKPTQIVLVHPLAPISRQHFRKRNATIAALAKYAAKQPLTTIVMGDFNATSWSVYFRNFIYNSRLRSANLGHGLNPTWFYNSSGRSLSPLEQVKQLLKIPIDHICVSQDVRVDQTFTLAAGVSDHRPLVANLRML